MTLAYANQQEGQVEGAEEQETPIGGDPVVSNAGQAELAERVRASRVRAVVEAKAEVPEEKKEADDKAHAENPYAGTLLKVGSRGEPVVFLQKALNKSGAALDPDGAFGPATRAAVVAFQQAAGIAADGIVGPQTWGKFDGAAVAVPKTPQQEKVAQEKEDKPDEKKPEKKPEDKKPEKTPDASSMGQAVISAGLALEGQVKARVPSGETREVEGRNVKLRTGADLLYKIISETSPGHAQRKADIMDVTVPIGPEGGQRVPSWCGIFALYLQNQAGNGGGVWPGPWMGPNIGPNKLHFRNPGETPRPGDVCYMSDRSHHGTVMEVKGNTVVSVEGNTGAESTIAVRTRSLGDWLAFARVIPKAEEDALDLE